MPKLEALEYGSFESIKQIAEDGSEFWVAEAAHRAGVITGQEFAIFQNAGYMGLYGGLTVADIRNAMIDMGTTLPENLPTPEKSIRAIEREEIRKLRDLQTKLMLDE